MIKHLLTTFFVVSMSLACAQKKGKIVLEVVSSTKLEIPEPSDLVFSPDGSKIFFVSDQGFVYQTDRNFKVENKSSFESFDLEACAFSNGFLYVVDERTRIIRKLASDFTVLRDFEVTYLAGRNKGFETLIALPNKFLLISEKDPTIIFECDTNFVVQKRTPFKGPSDISGGTWNNGNLYILSDEKHEIWELDPKNYAVLKKYYLPLFNLEGMAFDPEGRLWVLSDDMATIYEFKLSQE